MTNPEAQNINSAELAANALLGEKPIGLLADEDSMFEPQHSIHSDTLYPDTVLLEEAEEEEEMEVIGLDLTEPLVVVPCSPSVLRAALEQDPSYRPGDEVWDIPDGSNVFSSLEKGSMSRNRKPCKVKRTKSKG